MIIAIDGTSGSGKSTIAKELAKKLGYGFFSAGALYRAITVKVLNLEISDSDDERLMELATNTKIIYTYDGKENTMQLDGMNITDKLNTEEVGNMVAKIACKPYIREFVRTLQKQTAEYNKNIVMEGRDIGSVIFPDADLKVFVDCKIETRAKRRLADFNKLGENASLEKVIEELKERDYLDMHREISPLIMCEDAYLLDTSSYTVDECVDKLIKVLFDKNKIDNEFLEERNISL